ncbi:outer membrane protein assembly factor BamE [Sphingorhabdus soli]|uniref:Outer membrane protein assembly factor BamE n=1 Tax=Flavisphingopyxis soli TaxID=2601267 RepID=A0A5C6UKN9_9SPHN|nr:outer membrane protein assembly factor BamE [Sphingorhabdus soli]TXC73467.1 outer membrane protein assembly factor BamE [Sphingorhabdus soli]
MGNFARPTVLILASLVTAAALSGCTQTRMHRGQILDPLLSSSISPGVDNRDSVVGTLGRPTFVGQFTPNEWYYVSRTTKQLAFATPKPIEQTVMRVTFDEAGNVASVDRTGVELAQHINPNGDKTPTKGRDRSFFEELFGNIGTVGVPGTGAPPPN